MCHKLERTKQKGYMYAIAEASGCAISWRETNRRATYMP